MKAWHVLVLGALGAVLMDGLAPAAFAQGTDHFTITIPKKGNSTGTATFVPIGEVKAVIGIDSRVTGPVTFTLKDQNPATPAVSITCSPTSCSVCTTSTTCSPAVNIPFNNPESGSRGPDLVTIVPTSGPNDPVRYEMDFLLQSNLAPNSCANEQQTDPNTYLITVTSAPANVIVGVCLQSFDGRIRTTNPPTDSCTASNFWVNPIPIPHDAGDDVATVNGAPQPTFACSNARPPIDVVMVLDKSGSMASPANAASCPTPPCTTRMDALHSAVTNFLDDWAALSPPNDMVGVVSFDNAATVRIPLQDVVANKVTIEADVNNNLLPGGSTSIGGGLVAANPLVGSTTGRRKVVLLMTDGQQNTNPFVQSDVRFYCSNPADPACVAPILPSCTQGLGACTLANTPQIYTVTLGPATVVDPAITNQITNATLGFYLNTTNNAALLRPFFLQLLQNFVRFNSYETVRLVSAEVGPNTPYSTNLPIFPASQDLVISLMWPQNLGLLRLTATPPGGGKPIVRESASGFISLVQPLPVAAPYDPRGSWIIAVEAPEQPAGGGNTIPIDLHVMTDDPGIKSEMSVVPGDYKSGDNIRLRAKLIQFGRPILGLGSHPGDKIEVELIKPGKSIGDILSDSKASAVPSCSTPASCDPQTPVQAKLANTLQNDPSVLVEESDTVQLFDDGKPEHGDDVAGDGIYSALYPAPLPGHYNFLFAIESTDPSSVRFSRQQLRTAYVRAVPVASNTTFVTTILPCLKTHTAATAGGGRANTVNRGNFLIGCNRLFISMTPRTSSGSRLGPGWANYLWFTAPGFAPVKAQDSSGLDGTYSASFTFSGATPPKVQLHFENVVAIIGDSVTANQLPQPLDSSNTLADVPSNSWAVFGDFGAGIPNGNLGNGFNKGFSLNAGLEHTFTTFFALEGSFGYHHFPAKAGNSLNIYRFSVNPKLYLMRLAIGKVIVRPFADAGPGFYKLSPGPAKLGGNVGGGALFELTPRFGVQGSYNFHTAGGTAKFHTLQGGIRFVF